MKQLHKKIGRQVKKIPSHFTKYLFKRDNIFATLWVFIFIVGLGNIPLNLGSLNPIKLSLKDFDFNDLSYSKLDKHTDTLERNISIINIGHLDREGIALLIEKTASMGPKVMGLDALFDGPSDDERQDSILNETFGRHKNLVVAAQIILDTATRKLTLIRNHLKNAANYGYANFPNEDYETTRFFYPFKKDHDSIFPSFSAALLKQYSPAKYEEMKEMVEQKIMINYSRRTNRYQLIEGEAIMLDGVEPRLVKDKIVLLAYVNTDPNDIEDKKFTPMNAKYYGKSVPDMNGIVVHANIISMAMEDNYIKKLPLWTNLLIAVIICWLFMSFFIRYYLESHIWFHLVAKLAQVASAIIFVWLGIYLFDQYRLKVDMKMSLIVIVLAVDVIYFYEAWAVWMHKKFNYKTVFKPHHH